MTRREAKKRLRFMAEWWSPDVLIASCRDETSPGCIAEVVLGCDAGLGGFPSELLGSFENAVVTNVLLKLDRGESRRRPARHRRAAGVTRWRVSESGVDVAAKVGSRAAYHFRVGFPVDAAQSLINEPVSSPARTLIEVSMDNENERKAATRTCWHCDRPLHHCGGPNCQERDSDGTCCCDCNKCTPDEWRRS